MYYQLYEWNHALMSPARALNDAVRLYYKNPLNPLCYTELGRQIVAAGDVFERLTRRYGKPEFGIETTEIDGREVRVHERIVWEKPFCRLIHFHRDRPEGAPKQPNLVIVAPMSGHYATLLRGTVTAMLPDFEVFITDWADARMVPLAMGGFDLNDYIDYVIDIVQWLKGDCHMMAVCQPAVPVFAATALLEAHPTARRPKSITLMGGPIDTRENPTEVNLYAEKHDLDWFRRNVIMTVPLPHPGFLRQVYPGFLQLSGFMSMNFDRHLSAHYDYFDHLVKGDGDNADKHREFYDEYLSVMDLTAEFFLQTVETVFHHHSLPKGEMMHRRRPVDPGKITRTAILTVEGENDDISGIGQTRAAHALTPHLPAERHEHYMQAGVGHYGVFNGSRFRREIAPRIRDFVYRFDAETAAAHGGNGHAAPRNGATARAAADSQPATPDDVIADVTNAPAGATVLPTAPAVDAPEAVPQGAAAQGAASPDAVTAETVPGTEALPAAVDLAATDLAATEAAETAEIAPAPAPADVAPAETPSIEAPASEALAAEPAPTDKDPVAATSQSDDAIVDSAAAAFAEASPEAVADRPAEAAADAPADAAAEEAQAPETTARQADAEPGTQAAPGAEAAPEPEAATEPDAAPEGRASAMADASTAPEGSTGDETDAGAKAAASTEEAPATARKAPRRLLKRNASRPKRP